MNENKEVKYLKPRLTNELNELSGLIKDLPGSLIIRVKLAKIFRSIHQKLNEGNHSDTILDSIFDSLADIIPYERIGIAILENNDKNLKLKWVKSKTGISHIKKEFSAPIAHSSLKKIIDEGYPRIINDLAEYFDTHPASDTAHLILQEGIRSNLTCPIKVKGKAIGVIFFSSSLPNTYNSSHIDLFSEVAEGLTLIIDNELLH